MNKMHEESLITKCWDCVNMFFIFGPVQPQLAQIIWHLRKLLLSTNAAN